MVRSQESYARIQALRGWAASLDQSEAREHTIQIAEVLERLASLAAEERPLV